MIKNQNFKRNSHIDDLINDAVNNNEGVIGLNGALMVDTGEFSGRIPNDKFIVVVLFFFCRVNSLISFSLS